MRYEQGIYTVTQIAADIYRIENSHVFMDLIVGAHHALLWDTGYGYDDLGPVIPAAAKPSQSTSIILSMWA